MASLTFFSEEQNKHQTNTAEGYALPGSYVSNYFAQSGLNFWGRFSADVLSILALKSLQNDGARLAVLLDSKSIAWHQEKNRPDCRQVTS